MQRRSLQARRGQHRRVATALLALLVLAGCSETPSGGGSASGDAAGGGASDTTAADTSGGDVTASDTIGVAKWWTCPSVSGSAPTRAAGCEAPDDGTYGCKRAFVGLSHAGTNYTCNRCLGGDPKAQGTWRAIAFDSEDPDKPLGNNLREQLVIDGNTWHLHMRAEEDGKLQEVRVDGWYFCTDAVELASQRIVFVTTAAQPNDTLGWFSPDVFTGELLTKDGNLLAWGMHAGFEVDWIGYRNYCKVGELIGGKACKAPFETP